MANNFQRDDAMVYVALVTLPSGNGAVLPGSLEELQELLAAAVLMRGQVSARVEEHASYS